MLKFVHSSLSRQSQIRHCVLLGTKSKNSFDVLLVYSKYAEILSVVETDSGFDFHTFQTFIVETPLLWIDSCRDYIMSFTSTNQLLICKYETALERAATVDLSVPFSCDPENFSLFVFSRSKNYIIISSKNTDHFIIVNIKDPENPIVNPFFLESMILKDITVALDPSKKNGFLIWVESISNGGNSENDKEDESKNENESENENENENENNENNENEKENEKESENKNEKEDKNENEDESEDEKEKEIENDEVKNTNEVKNSNEGKNEMKKQQHFLWFDAESQKVDKTEATPDGFIGFIPSCDTTRSVCAYLRKNAIEIVSKHPLAISSPVKTLSRFSFGYFMCQLESNEIILAGSDPKFSLTITEAPKCQNIWALPSKIFLCSTAETAAFFLIKKMKRKSISFKQLQLILEIPVNPGPMTNIFYDVDKRILLTSSKEGVYQMDNIAHIDLGKPICKADETTSNNNNNNNDNNINNIGNNNKIEIFAPVPDVVMVSNENGTRLICGEASICKKSTIAVLYFYSKHVQVHRNGIDEIDGDPLYRCTPSTTAKATSSKNSKESTSVVISSTCDRENNFIKCAASNGLRLVLGMENGHVVLFHGTFNESSEMEIPFVEKVAICSTFFVVAQFNKVMLFNFALEKFSEYSIPSMPVSIVIKNNGCQYAIFVSLHCGAILKIMENCICYVCTLRKDPIILQIKENEQVMLFADNSALYVYENSRIVRTDLVDVDAICASYTDQDEDEDTVPELNICVINKKKLFSFKYAEITYYYSFQKSNDLPNAEIFIYKSALLSPGSTLFAFTRTNKYIKNEIRNDSVEENKIDPKIESEKNESKTESKIESKTESKGASKNVSKNDNKTVSKTGNKNCNKSGGSKSGNKKTEVKIENITMNDGNINDPITSIIEYDSKDILFQFPDHLHITSYTFCRGNLFVLAGNLLYCFGPNEGSKLTKLYDIEFKETPLAIASLFDDIVIGFGLEIKIAKISESEHKLRFYKVSIKIISPVKKFVENGLVWVLLENCTVFTFIFDKKLEKFEIIAYGNVRNDLDHFCPVDSRTIAAVSNSKIVYFIRMPEKRISSCVNEPNFEVIGKYNSFDEIVSMKKVGDALVYLTSDGSAHALTCCNKDTGFRIMQDCQMKLRNEVLKLFAFSEENEFAIWNQPNTVDADILDVLKPQYHQAKGEQEFFGALMINERQKIIF